MVMGKKKPQKTKELSVAIAEASSAGEETSQRQTHQQITQPQTPRKRGRPRKVVEKTEISQQEKQEQTAEEAGGEAEISITGSSLKKGKSNEEHQQHAEQQQESSLACTRITKDPKGEPSRSRARRKSKPRKSS